MLLPPAGRDDKEDRPRRQALPAPMPKSFPPLEISCALQGLVHSHPPKLHPPSTYPKSLISFRVFSNIPDTTITLLHMGHSQRNCWCSQAMDSVTALIPIPPEGSSATPQKVNAPLPSRDHVTYSFGGLRAPQRQDSLLLRFWFPKSVRTLTIRILRQLPHT